MPNVVSSSSQSSSSSVSESSYSASSSLTSASCSSIDTALFESAFGLASINSAESQLYLQYLANVPSAQLNYFNEMMSYYTSTSFVLADSVTDFVAFQNEMNSMYQLLSAQSLFAANADWATATTICQQAKANLVNALGYTTQGCCLYNLLNFASTDLTYLPLVAGTCYHLAVLQNQYYTASSSSSSYQESSSYQASSSSSSMTAASSVAVC